MRKINGLMNYMIRKKLGIIPPKENQDKEKAGELKTETQEEFTKRINKALRKGTGEK